MNHTQDQVDAIISRFKELGVEKAGATHCTGDRSIEQFKNGYGRDYVKMGVGKILTFSK